MHLGKATVTKPVAIRKGLERCCTPAVSPRRSATRSTILQLGSDQILSTDIVKCSKLVANIE